MSQATFVHLCHLSVHKFDTAPQHHVRLVHFLADKLCGKQPTPLGRVANSAHLHPGEHLG